LTIRIFALGERKRLYVGEHAHGKYTLKPVRLNDTVIFAATGTGEAPHNAMLAELLARGHRGPIVAVTCARRRRDLAYLDAHRELERRYPRYRYVPLTTREPENVDPAVPNYVGKRYLQDYFATGAIQHDTGVSLRPDQTHVFLCGNPAMIGAPRLLGDGRRDYPEPVGMVEVLERRGFRTDLLRSPGNIHFEKYW
jgi:ferredoxin--NADP+ reductase